MEEKDEEQSSVFFTQLLLLTELLFQAENWRESRKQGRERERLYRLGKPGPKPMEASRDTLGPSASTLNTYRQTP